MKKYLFLILPILAVILGVIYFYRQRPKNMDKNPPPSGNREVNDQARFNDNYSENGLPPQIISVLPLDKELNVPLNSPIVITFDRKFKPNEIAFSFAPDIITKSTVAENVLTVTPLVSFQSGMQYTYIIKYAATPIPSSTYSFTTEGDLRPLPDTRVEEAVIKENEFQKQNHPEVFLANQTPYSSGTFEITAEFDNTLQNPHFVFSVSLKSSSGKADFDAWAMSSGLSQEQLALLDIEFR